MFAAVVEAGENVSDRPSPCNAGPVYHIIAAVMMTAANNDNRTFSAAVATPIPRGGAAMQSTARRDPTRVCDAGRCASEVND
jgi:hypothetical protein